MPGTELYVRGLRPAGNSIRLRLGDSQSGSLLVDLPTRRAESDEWIATWWYVGALRDITRWATDPQTTAGAYAEPEVIDAATPAEAGVLPHDAEVTGADSLDYVLGDLADDPLWHGAAGSAAPDLYRMVGFDAHSPGIVRVYLVGDGRTIGVDLATRDTKTAEPRSVGWWASTKLIALLNPDDEQTLAAHHRDDTDDPCCEAVYDLAEWA
ncbi:hypothetical protein [Streptomyces griseocarneus]|uniref:hypothetical protein n=1 Tax=Streptomyces griseocarneus TaxID=51201 RepID=UPI00167E922A|nr:hypothetical protein [Streptomyces griseocarneus]MBZ6473179.1 hypothetical protein [Streptomyces griseocarneus]GHG60260.1 hypothetical protein GCM10018779_27460 [Streptomyces griseocarneus]